MYLQQESDILDMKRRSKGRNRSTGFIGCAWRLYDRRRCQGDEGACKTESADDSSFVSNYEMTVGAMIESNEIGIRIPEDLSVIGFDNIEFAKASNPKLSIVTQPTKKSAEM